MVDYFDCCLQSQSFDISGLLKELDLPIRIKNILAANSFSSERDFYETVDRLVLEHTSNYLLPNRLVSFYPQVREYRASRELICNLSGARIKKGSLYYTYHPFIEDLKTGRVYTIKKSIRAELGFIDLFPQDLFTYEEWYYRVKNAYYSNSDSQVDFYNLSSECGDDCLELYLLGNGNKKRKK